MLCIIRNDRAKTQMLAVEVSASDPQKGKEQMKLTEVGFRGLAVLCGLVLLGQSIAAQKATTYKTHKASGILQPFRYTDVTLTGGPMGTQAEGARDFYLSLSEDNLLNGFRKRAGLPAPGKPMGGWYDPDGFAGAHPFGQYVSALARMYANTGDVRYKEKVVRLVHGFHEALAPDGFFYSSQKVFKEWPNYLYDKNCIGMRDAYTLTGSEEALTILKKMTDWAVKNLPRRRDEWYTLPENLYNCYALTKDPRYLQMAKEYDYSKEYYDPFANGINAFTPQRHAYSHVNTLASAAKAYEVTGDEKYFKAIDNAWTFLTTTQMYASGGWGADEHFVTPGQGKLAASLDSTGAHFETPCGSYANVNLDRYLLRFTGNPKYGDNMERVLYNGMLATLPMQPDGKTFYYSDYRSGTKKAYFGAAWPCCSGTYAQITADYPLDIYFHDERGLYVNLFTPSRVQWQQGKQAITVEQTTTYPETDTTTLTVHTKKPMRFALRVRVPAWTAKPAVAKVNNRLMQITATPGTFLTVEQVWRDGDTLQVTFPMALRYEPIAPETPDKQALLYGPLLLVALSDKPVSMEGERAVIDGVKQPDALPTFRTHDGAITFLPLYKVKDERYTTYLSVPPVR